MNHVIIRNVTNDHLIEKDSHSNEHVNNISNGISHQIPLNNHVKHIGGSTLHTVTKEVPQFIAKVGHYPTSDNDDENHMFKNKISKLMI